ncbi:hypothetical protein E4O04_06550 [Treponema sp. OMZ 799]|uniref:hypothetical protein n=1 Tax=Treponema sp. OMZ 799 TaxID=2563668 RepID=UPI0020A39EA9|nr:hypothetical protein [Treponema sp. OMZ 799]UTC77676.1 hypothetical protein E4O04_06550 [Treponema sp. OMZ 799]
MRASKEKKENFEAEIKYLADEFFSIPKEDNSIASKRNTLKTELWIELWRYYKEIQYTGLENDDEITAEKYSDVINDTISKSMEAYKIEKETPFLHYVNAAVKNEISRERQKEYLHGLKVPQKIFRQWKELVQLAHSRGIDIRDINKMRELGSLLHYSENILEQVLDLGKVKIGSDQTKIDGKERSVFDILESSIGNPEKGFEKKEELEAVLHRFIIMDNFFQKKQERVKKYLSALLTLEFFSALDALNKMIGQKQNFSFVDLELYAELEEIEVKGFKVPAKQDIAARFKRDKTDASRTLKNFLKEIEEKVSTL